MSDQDKVEFRYEGEQDQPDKLECVYTYRGKEYRLPYLFIVSLARLYGIPDAVRGEILFWAKMIHNPD